MLNHFVFLGILSFLFVASVSASKTEPVVEVSNGQVIGETRGHYFAFEGIPYAEAERFEPPSPYIQQWTEPWNATRIGSACMQWDQFKFEDEDKLEGIEDCLFINVYTPSLERENLPVFVYIHGGCFMFGTGDMHGPELITTRPGILVNFNYRLGPLGFLSTEDEVVPGNMGLKDQVQALKWVQKNIAAFGGDPQKVTITGFSAGGYSVHLHYLSPLSVGLFRNGISHSNSAFNPDAIAEKAGERAKKMGDIFGCPTSDSRTMITCLKRQPAEDIVRAVKEFQPWLYNPFSPFAATVEPDVPGAFITAKPADIMRSGKFQRLPWLSSATQAEGLYPTAEFLRYSEYLPYIDQHWNEVMPLILHYNDTLPACRLDKVSQKIRKHYLGCSKLDEMSFPLLVDMASDRMYFHGLSQTARLHSAFAPSYFYFFNYKTQYGVAEFMSRRDDFKFGAAHGEDVQLLYSNGLRGDRHPYTPDEKILIELLLDMYFSFAETGVPSLGTYTIPPMQYNEQLLLRYADIAGPFSIKTATVQNFGQEMFWMSLGFDEN